MAYWDESSSDYQSAGPDSHGIYTDWGGGQDPAGNYMKYARLKYRTRGARGGFMGSGGRKRIRGTGTYEVQAGQEDQFREWQEANMGKEFEQDRDHAGRSFKGDGYYSGFTLGRLDAAHTANSFFVPPAYKEKRKRHKAMIDRRTWWDRETTQGPRGQSRVAQLGSENMLRGAYEEARERLGGWGSQA